ncbi:MAG: LiaI-LiaF-like domain-containing protein [Halodesulfurarchaeum sp.]
MTHRSTGRIVTALLVVLVGILLLASTTGAFGTESIWAWIPLVFVLLGIWAIWKSGGRNLTGPIMVIAIAGTFQLRNLGLLTDQQIGTWWPLFVVLFGILLLVGRERRHRFHVSPTDADELSVVSVFGSSDQRITAEAFVGGEVVSLFGGASVDLRDAVITDPPAVIETVAIFGGPEIRVPEEWNVRIDVLPLFGGTEDKRPRDADRSAETDLVVTGVVLFGGLTVLD